MLKDRDEYQLHKFLVLKIITEGLSILIIVYNLHFAETDRETK